MKFTKSREIISHRAIIDQWKGVAMHADISKDTHDLSLIEMNLSYAEMGFYFSRSFITD